MREGGENSNHLLLFSLICSANLSLSTCFLLGFEGWKVSVFFTVNYFAAAFIREKIWGNEFLMFPEKMKEFFNNPKRLFFFGKISKDQEWMNNKIRSLEELHRRPSVIWLRTAVILWFVIWGYIFIAKLGESLTGYYLPLALVTYLLLSSYLSVQMLFSLGTSLLLVCFCVMRLPAEEVWLLFPQLVLTLMSLTVYRRFSRITNSPELRLQAVAGGTALIVALIFMSWSVIRPIETDLGSRRENSLKEKIKNKIAEQMVKQINNRDLQAPAVPNINKEPLPSAPSNVEFAGRDQFSQDGDRLSTGESTSRRVGFGEGNHSKNQGSKDRGHSASQGSKDRGHSASQGSKEGDHSVGQGSKERDHSVSQGSKDGDHAVSQGSKDGDQSVIQSSGVGGHSNSRDSGVGGRSISRDSGVGRYSNSRGSGGGRLKLPRVGRERLGVKEMKKRIENFEKSQKKKYGKLDPRSTEMNRLREDLGTAQRELERHRPGSVNLNTRETGTHTKKEYQMWHQKKSELNDLNSRMEKIDKKSYEERMVRLKSELANKKNIRPMNSTNNGSARNSKVIEKEIKSLEDAFEEIEKKRSLQIAKKREGSSRESRLTGSLTETESGQEKNGHNLGSGPRGNELAGAGGDSESGRGQEGQNLRNAPRRNGLAEAGADSESDRGQEGQNLGNAPRGNGLAEAGADSESGRGQEGQSLESGPRGNELAEAGADSESGRGQEGQNLGSGLGESGSSEGYVKNDSRRRQPRGGGF